MKERNLKLFYLHELFFQFSDSMLVLVLPVFIYKTFQSISAVFLFSMTWNIIHGCLFLPIFNLAMKFKHPKYFMMAGIVFYISSQWLFSLVTPENKMLMIPATLLFALYISFYWMIRHWFIGSNADHTKIGRQVSIAALVRTFIAVLAPISAGGISLIFSFNTTFFLGVIAGALSLIPIAKFTASPHPEVYTLKKVGQMLTKKEITNVMPGYLWEGVTANSVSTAWILIFTIFIGSILQLGLLMGVTTLITGLTIWLTGAHFDKRNRANLLTRLTYVRSLTVAAYTTIYFFPHLIYIGIIEFMNRLSAAMQGMALDSYFYAYGSKIHAVDFILAREICLSFTRFLTSGLLAFLFYYLPAKVLWPVLLLGSFSILGMMYAKKNDHHLNEAVTHS